MVESETRGGVFGRRYERLLSEDVHAFLTARAFSKTNHTFRRDRGPLYDLIGFQSDRWNGATPWHGFFVNIGVGSTEVDEACRRSMCLLSRRWERVVPELPYELAFDETTDMAAFAERLCEGLDQVLAVIEKLKTTDELVSWAIDNNRLFAMEHTCAYLAATDDVDLLTRYIGELRDEFGAQSRWVIFNRQLVEATGSRADVLILQGALDPVEPV